MGSITLEWTMGRMKKIRAGLAPLGLSKRTTNVLARSLIPFDTLCDIAANRPYLLLEIKLCGVVAQQEFIEALIKHRYIERQVDQ